MSAGSGCRSLVVGNSGLAFRTWWIGWFNRRFSKSWSRSSNRRFTPAVMASACTAAPTPRSPRQRSIRFVRYADDSNIFVRSARAGERVMASIRHFLERRMRLKVNEEKSGIRQPHEVHFLGFRFQCRQTAEGWHTAVLLSAKAERRLRTTVREMTPPNWGQSLTACMKELSRYLNGWVAHLGIGDRGICCHQFALWVRLLRPYRITFQKSDI